MIEKFLDILTGTKMDEIIPFMKSLSLKERKVLAKELKPLNTEWHKYDPRRQEHKGSFDQLEILRIASFVCFSRTEYNRSEIWYLPKDESLSGILPWYIPEWFQQSLITGNGPNQSSTLVNWQQEGYINLPQEYIASFLAIKFNFEDIVEEIRDFSLVREEYIWYLFSYQTEISYAGYGWYSGGKTSKEVFILLSEEGVIDRVRLLRACVSFDPQVFNTPMRSWFLDLFEGLKPSDAEILDLQSELFLLLACPFSNVVNKILKMCKPFIKHADFHLDDFLMNLPILMASETKSVVVTAIDIATSLLKSKTTSPDLICGYLLNGFINKNVDVQNKIIKVISQYGNPQLIAQEIVVYEGSILNVVQPALDAFLGDAKSVETVAETHVQVDSQVLLEEESVLSDNNRIEIIDNLDDFLFFASQAFENNEPYHFDLLVASLTKVAAQLEDNNVERLEPILQKAYKKIPDWDWRQAILDKLSAAFVLSYCDYLIEQYPNQAKGILELKNRYDRMPVRIETWEKTKQYSYMGYVSILSYALDIIKNKVDQPLLSTPTHSPTWIDPMVLADRLKYYQENNIEPDNMDIQLAMQRCVLQNTSDITIYIKQTLKDEYAGLLLYLVGQEPDMSVVKHSNWWLAATLIRPEKSHYKGFMDDNAKRLSSQFFDKSLPFTKPNSDNTGQIVLEEVSIPLFYFTKKLKPSLFYEYIFAKPEDSFYSLDLSRILLSCPNNHEVLLAAFKNRFLYSPNVREEKVILQVLKVIVDMRQPFTSMDYLVFSSAMFHSIATVKAFAGEVWLERVSKADFDIAYIGEIQGMLINAGWAPVKRYTDLVMSLFMGVDDLHNRAVETLFISLLSQIHQPIKDLKLLLEIYAEILSTNKSRIDDALKVKIEEWAKVASLKKVCKMFL